MLKCQMLIFPICEIIKIILIGILDLSFQTDEGVGSSYA